MSTTPCTRTMNDPKFVSIWYSRKNISACGCLDKVKTSTKKYLLNTYYNFEKKLVAETKSDKFMERNVCVA